MGKKFMGYDNASELITAIGTKIKAKYTKPNTGIPKSDLATDVQTSLDQVSTNQTNILYAINTGVKNLFNPIDKFSGSSTISTINNGDGTYKITGGATFASIQYASFFLKAGTYVLSGCPENGSDNTYRLELRTESSTVGTIIDYGTGATAIIENSGYYLMTIRLAANYTAPSSGLLFKPMICEKTVWDSTNHDFQPPALPNYELTKLETEDRAMLVEQVDSEAKNEFIFGDFTTGGQVGTTVTTSDNAVTVTGASAWAKAWRTFRVTKNTTYVLSFRVTNVATVASPNYRVSLGNNHHSGGSYYGIIGCNTTGNYYITFTPPIDTDIYLVINPNYTSTAASDMPSITVDNIMICTEAAFRVSPVYVPYHKSLDQLEAEDRAALIEVVDSGAKNVFNINNITNVSPSLTITGSTITMTTDDSLSNLWLWCRIFNNSAVVVADLFDTTITTNKIYTVRFTKTSNMSYIRIGHNGANTDGKFNYSINDLPDGDYILRVNVFNCAIANGHLSWGDIMICTEADWKVSQNFAPYRPSWDLVRTLFPTTYTAPVVNSDISSKLSILSGGYAKAGNLVTVNLRLSVTDTISADSALFTGLPAPKTTASLSYGSAVVPVTNMCVNAQASPNVMSIDTQGTIRLAGTSVSSDITTGIYILSATYLSA